MEKIKINENIKDNNNINNSNKEINKWLIIIFNGWDELNNDFHLMVIFCNLL